MKHIFTLPENFIIDQSVPARWRLLCIINGFLINGRDFYASNEWVSQRLNCSQQTVTNAVKELEELGEISCTRTLNSRVIKRGTNQLVGGYKPTGMPDPNQLVPNSYNIIPLNNTSEDKPRKVKKDTSYRKIFELWGKFPLNWTLNTTQIAAAKNLLAEHEYEQIKKALDFYKKNSSQDWCPQILSPYDLDAKWNKLLAFKNKTS